MKWLEAVFDVLFSLPRWVSGLLPAGRPFMGRSWAELYDHGTWLALTVGLLAVVFVTIRAHHFPWPSLTERKSVRYMNRPFWMPVVTIWSGLAVWALWVLLTDVYAGPVTIPFALVAACKWLWWGMLVSVLCYWAGFRLLSRWIGCMKRYRMVGFKSLTGAGR